jgi:hypothetical protein
MFSHHHHHPHLVEVVILLVEVDGLSKMMTGVLGPELFEAVASAEYDTVNDKGLKVSVPFPGSSVFASTSSAPSIFRQSALDERESTIATLESSSNVRESSIAERDSVITKRESSITSRESTISELESAPTMNLKLNDEWEISNNVRWKWRRESLR